MILVSDLIESMRNVGLDASPDTDYYDDQIDLIPAINSAVKWTVSVINAAKAQSKNTQEILRELSFAGVFQLSNLSRVILPNKIWSIDAVYPLPLTSQTPGIAPVVQTDIKVSIERPDLTHRKSSYSAHRKTIEEWSFKSNDPFVSGYDGNSGNPLLVNGSDLNILFAYLDPYTYNGYGTTATPPAPTNVEVEIAPSVPNRLCTIFYTKTPDTVTQTTDNILFPTSAFDLIYNKALQFVSFSQGDQTTLWQVTANDVNLLFKSVS